MPSASSFQQIISHVSHHAGLPRPGPRTKRPTSSSSWRNALRARGRLPTMLKCGALYRLRSTSRIASVQCLRVLPVIALHILTASCHCPILWPVSFMCGSPGILHTGQRAACWRCAAEQRPGGHAAAPDPKIRQLRRGSRAPHPHAAPDSRQAH